MKSITKFLFETELKNFSTRDMANWLRIEKRLATIIPKKLKERKK